jgi:hypothetical protein
LVQLGLGKSVINYSRLDVGIEEYKNNVELQLEQAESLNKDKGGVESALIDNLMISTVKNTYKYVRYGQRYVLFSSQFKIVKTLTSQLIKYPIRSIRTEIVYNFANPRKFSKFLFNSEISTHMSAQGLEINKSLFFTIYDLFIKRYDLNTQNIDRVRLAAIADTLKLQFSDKDTLQIYSNYFIDFRGRVYSESTFSVTSVKLLRYIISTIKDIPLLKNKHYNYLITLLPLIPESIRNIRQFSTDELIILLIGFLNLGKLVKSKLLVKYCVTLESFIKTGIEIYTIDMKIFLVKYDISNIDDIGYLITTKEKLYKYIHQKKLFTIILDSTASGIFHLNI